MATDDSGTLYNPPSPPETCPSNFTDTNRWLNFDWRHVVSLDEDVVTTGLELRYGAKRPFEKLDFKKWFSIIVGLPVTKIKAIAFWYQKSPDFVDKWIPPSQCGDHAWEQLYKKAAKIHYDQSRLVLIEGAVYELDLAKVTPNARMIALMKGKICTWSAQPSAIDATLPLQRTTTKRKSKRRRQESALEISDTSTTGLLEESAPSVLLPVSTDSAPSTWLPESTTMQQVQDAIDDTAGRHSEHGSPNSPQGVLPDGSGRHWSDGVISDIDSFFISSIPSPPCADIDCFMVPNISAPANAREMEVGLPDLVHFEDQNDHH